MTPGELRRALSQLIDKKIQLSVMIWGPPGVGKSSVVAQAADDHGMRLIDVRLSQLAPTDLRGLPVPDQGVARWYPPEFLPREGRGVLFLDELNMAPPAVQGIAQQLILDRRVGGYEVPPGWYLWAAGNRKEDRASVFDLPSPLANRFLHLDVAPDLESFKRHAIERGVHEQIVAFLSYRPALLHKIDSQRPAWPSPRSWSMASRLHAVGLGVEPAVGGPTAEEFRAFLSVYEKLQCMDDVLAGQGKRHRFPQEPSLRYALTVGLSLRARSKEQALAALRWLIDGAGAEWAQLYLTGVEVHLKALRLWTPFVLSCQTDPALLAFFKEARGLLQG